MPRAGSVRAGAPWRLLPHDFPPWGIVYQQTVRWLKAGSFEAIVHDLRALLRLDAGREAQPSAVVLDSRTLRSSPESGHRAGYDGAKRERGSKLHVAVDTLGHLLAAHVTPAAEQDRAQVGRLAEMAQEDRKHASDGESVELAHVDQGYKGEEPQAEAEERGLRLEVVELPEARRGFVLLPRRWVVEAPSLGPHGSGGSRATTSDRRRRSKACTSSPSPSSRSAAQAPSSRVVPNTL